MSIIDGYLAALGYRCSVVAGTLVHAKSGLIPIERVKPGDQLVSQLDQEEPACRPVVRAARHEEAPIWTLTYFSRAEQEQAAAEGRMMRRDCERRLVGTANALFRLVGGGWCRASDLHVEMEVELINRRAAVIVVSTPLYRSQIEGVAWEEGTFDPDNGVLVELRNGRSGERDLLGDGATRAFQPPFVERWEETSYYRCPVYSLEIDEGASYFVGTMGLRTLAPLGT